MTSTKERPSGHKKPLVYSCSGCSNIAQLANDVAVKMDRAGLAEMSCIAGVGGNVKPLVKLAQSGRRIIAIDGCVLKCAKSCLNNVGVEPDVHYVLTDYGMKKEYHKDYNDEIVDEFYEIISGKNKDAD
ncbi:MAG: zinc-binding protein [Stygiobacter sp. RIFOXYA12_FULL_38_9]|nr:MAG: zinc-binding protein [Stygiobacter sp. GWC2_38_9]OGU83945.1 MAG: zinc-binding protein [Stygiobacter sp. RIFOXYA12_FULL_38_9]OGV09306.1 MAG: zinc-binding protein [Stygiobacter sp. RIFOXYB2_FULL_37_11]OGV11740.1 MAG: zinc-binding protein [Stygiobacter sp. RIFOXYA2_FULL_38_8]OGV16553.1 MAG: zinc-binding protein [Stygiobacter sp. RIFOXYC2_FULL_38_25]OGV79865.1 MAG: zinc-binding protein [Stygiobacter sp. GWF2_38_21]RJQ60889.1 MAG: zinc-binding protein [Stygiobacter sp.]HAB53660.1 zinc-bin